MYAEFSKYYDKIHRQISDDLPLILELGLRFGGPIVELGCGSGRLLLPLARAGLQVIGIDDSPEMLAILNEEASKETEAVKQNIAVLSADFSTPQTLNRTASLVIIGYNTILHLNQDELAQTLKNCASWLSPQASLLIDVDNPINLAFAANEMHENGVENQFEEEFRFPAAKKDERDTVVYTRLRFSPGTQTYFVDWKIDRPGDMTEATFELHYHHTHQLQIALENAGFRIRSIWGGYDKSPYDETSDRLIILAAYLG